MKEALYWNPSPNLDSSRPDASRPDASRLDTSRRDASRLSSPNLDESNLSVDCHLCPQNCHIRPGRVGTCRVRKNEAGRLYSLNYGQYSSLALDPTEKKPLNHFYPGSYLVSIGTVGCNLTCGFCQNWTISQNPDTNTRDISPEQLVKIAATARDEDPRTVGIAYTYNEPLMWYEFVLDTARLARERELANVLVTNGFIEEEPLRELLPYIDAMNIDVKGFTGEFYKKVCHGDLSPVKRTVTAACAASVHVEVTTLLIPGHNDDPGEIAALSQWLSGVSPDIPLHFSRYYPNYKFDVPATPVETLVKAKTIAEKHLNYVYLGNVWGRDGNDTLCPQCHRKVIERGMLGVTAVNLRGGNCASCGREISLRGKAFEPEGE